MPVAPRLVVERHHSPGLDGVAQEAEQAGVEARARTGPHGQPFRHHQRLQVGLDVNQGVLLQQGAQLVGELAQHGGPLLQPGAVERRRGRVQFRQLLRGNRDQTAQRRGAQPPVMPPFAGIHQFERSEHVLDRVAEPLGRAPRDLEIALYVVEREPTPRPLQP